MAWLNTLACYTESIQQGMQLQKVRGRDFYDPTHIDSKRAQKRDQNYDLR
ncbi:hypothetical protein VPAL9027_01908 [Vibrio palustris]|uniref:Uncharacterized protein n=1 Tax=Vibrio palustris TaxID=1918946 RepID=A0A1R4B4U6_9VIBR|nr:hypothetical protein VPAL9027_01908 [Vibrio palustris]